MIKKILLMSSLLFITTTFIFAGVEDELKKINQKLVQIEKKIDALSSNNKKQPTAPNNAVYNIPVSNSVVLGNPSAPITVLEFTDFQ